MGRPARAAFGVMFVLLLGRILGLVRDLILAPIFGAGIQIDAIVAARTIPELVLTVTTAGAIRASVVPTLGRLTANQSETAAWSAASALSNWLILGVLFVAGLLITWPGPALQIVLPGLSGAQLELSTMLLRVFMVCVVVQVAGSSIAAMLNFRDRYVIPAVAPVLINASVIALTLLRWRVWGVLAVAIGWLVGTVLYFAAQVLILKPAKVHYTRTLEFRTSGFRFALGMMAPVLVAQALLHSRFIVERFFTSTLAIGSLTILSYAYRITAIPQNIVTNSIVTTFLPSLSRRSAAEDSKSFVDEFGKAYRLMLAAILPAAALLIVFARPLIGILLERGEFSSDAAAATAALVPWYAVVMLLASASLLFSQVHYSRFDSRSPLLAMFIGIAVQVLVTFVGVGPVGLAGVALGTVAGLGATTLVLGVTLVRNVPMILPQLYSRAVWSYLAAALVTALGVLVLFRELKDLFPDQWQLSLVVCLLSSLPVYGALLLAVGDQEISGAFRALIRRVANREDRGG